MRLIHEDLEELKKRKLLFVAGGVGAAPVYPQVKWLHEQGIKADVIIGSKNKRSYYFRRRNEKSCRKSLCIQLMMVLMDLKELSYRYA